MQTKEVVIVSAVRTAVGRGKKDGSLAATHAVDLSAAVMRAAVERVKLDPALIEDVLWGCAMPESSQGLNISRLAVLRSGFPVDVSGATINRFCSSGLQTVAMAAQANVATGMGDVVMAGGVEMMSAVPMSGFHTRLHPDMTEQNIGMGFTAERVATRWNITREMQDQYALGSQQKAAAAWSKNVFADQIIPVTVQKVRWKGSKKTVEESAFVADELVRASTTMEGLAKLPPAFKPGGSVTAGNSSPLSDGAAAVLMMSADKAKSSASNRSRVSCTSRPRSRARCHGNRTGESGAEGARARGTETQRYEIDRVQRSVCIASTRGDSRSPKWTSRA